MSDENLKVLEANKLLYVYYVRDENKVEVKGKEGNVHQIYKQAYPCSIEDLDVITYSKFIFEKGYQPPATQVAKVFPNPNGIFPGIMIRENQDFYKNWGELYYALKGGCGIDRTSRSMIDWASVLERRRQIYPKILEFKERVYAPLNESREAFERGLIELVKENLDKPETFLDLFILSEPKARFVNYGEIDLEDALDKDIRLGIDDHAAWLLALKVISSEH